MNLTKEQEQEQKIFTNKVIEVAIRLVLTFLIVGLCFEIIKPFMIIVVWGVIIAVAIYPLYCRLTRALGGRNTLAATLYTLLTLTLLVGPTIMLSSSVVTTTSHLATEFNNGILTIPPAKKSVSEWPLVGESIYNTWDQASTNLEATLKQHGDQIKKLGEVFISAIAGVGGSVLQFIFSIIISGVFLANTQSAHDITIKIASRLTDKEQGIQLTNLSYSSNSGGCRDVFYGCTRLGALDCIYSDSCRGTITATFSASSCNALCFFCCGYNTRYYICNLECYCQYE